MGKLRIKSKGTRSKIVHTVKITPLVTDEEALERDIFPKCPKCANCLLHPRAL